MADKEGKPPHKPPNKQGMKHRLDDNDETDDKKKHVLNVILLQVLNVILFQD